MAAISMVMELFKPGDTIISSDDLYGGSIRLFRFVNEKNGLNFRYVNTSHLDDVEKAYVRYVETDFGADDVYIILPKDGEDENGNSHHENVLAALRERKDDRIREFVNYDVYNSSAIAENAVIFERGGYVVMLMLEDNDSARRIVERYIPEKLNLS